MSKKHYIDLARTIRDNRAAFSDEAIARLADFCARQNCNFNRERWLGYIEGTCGPSGGAVK